ncbi:hypothetical protein [Traorella massiliensis]|uniref:hypothetical protein n=1 Tax=Traorella massiliensis TaxID=1903263 RepID=UPI000A6049B7|nr:hypothetical protein [Traorella massiliensis]
MKKSIFSRFMKALAMEIREHKSTFIVYSVLRLAVIAVGILQFFNGNYENVFLCILTLILLMVPSFIQLTFKVELPTTLEIIILLFIFAAEILGEIDDYYLLFPFWDTMLHTINGFLAAAIGFSLVTLLNDSEKIQFELSPIFVVIVAFCFSMTIGVVWEFFEFGMDQIFGMDTQKDTIIHILNSVSISADGSMTTFRDIGNVVIDGTALPIHGYLDIGLIDTMQDLIVNFIGASVFSVFGFFYIKFKGKINLVNRFIPTKKSKDRDYLEKVINDAE